MKRAYHFPVKAHQGILTTICFMQVLLFAYTGCSKLIDQPNFYKQLTVFMPWPVSAAIISYTIPVAELIIAMGIIFQRTRLASMYAFCFLLIIFTVYIIVLLLGNRDLPCSCGGVISTMNWQQHLVFNIACIALSCTGIYLQHIVNRKINI